MQPEQAAMMRDALLAAFKAEFSATKRVIQAVPADKGEYKPDEKAMSAMQLSWHIASSEMWFLHSIADGEFKFEERAKPENVKTAADVAEWYEAEFPKAVARVQTLSGEQLAKAVQFAMWTNPLIETLGLALRHSVHHRGQLSTYLRPMGSKVPSIYGPSADVSFEEVAAQAGAATA